MFPSWSATSNDLAGGGWLSWRRRRIGKVWARRALLVFCALVMVWLFVGKAPGSDIMLNAQLSKRDFEELGMRPFQRPELRTDNPWRGAGRRFRKDIIMSVSGCGGRFRKSISAGERASLRYSLRDAGGEVVDSSDGRADVVVGSGQVDEEIERNMHGLCEGEAVRFRTRDGRRVLLYIERVGSVRKNDKAVEDKLAKVVRALPGRKGRSCLSTCRMSGLECEDRGFVVVNNCPRLRETFGCRKCEIAAAGSGGADMPAYVVKLAPVGHARGTCLASPDVRRSSCEARYGYTKRLCPCFEDGVVKKVVEAD